MNRDKQELLFKKISASSYFLIPILLFIFILLFTQTPSEEEYLRSDPLIRLMSYPWISMATLVLGCISLTFWIKAVKHEKVDILNAGQWALAGVLFSVSAVLALYFINGPQLPSFIPKEESSAAGLLLGLSAGVLEEICFRLIILPLLIFLLAKKLSWKLSIVLSVIITALLFSLSHELAGDPFQLHFFITRFIVPGVVMSVIFLKIHPAAMMIGHSCAHIAIAYFLTSP